MPTTVKLTAASSAPVLIVIQFEGGTPKTLRSNGDTTFQLNQGIFNMGYNISAQAQAARVTVSLSGAVMRPIARDIPASGKGNGIRTVRVA